MRFRKCQVLNIACSRGIKGTKLTQDWERLADPDRSESAKKIQILYMSYNNLEVFPENEYLKNMEKLGLLDCMSNKITNTTPFGSDIKLTQLNLNYNKQRNSGKILRIHRPSRNFEFCA